MSAQLTPVGKIIESMGIDGADPVQIEKNLKRFLSGWQDSERTETKGNTNEVIRHRELPITGFVRDRQAADHFSVARSTWWKWVKEGRAPQPIRASTKITIWAAEDIHEFAQQLREESRK